MKSAEKGTARVTLAMQADAETQAKIAAFAEQRGCPNVRYTLDPSILGGIVIQIGDTIYDGSVRTRLETVRRSV